MKLFQTSKRQSNSVPLTRTSEMSLSQSSNRKQSTLNHSKKHCRDCFLLSIQRSQFLFKLKELLLKNFLNSTKETLKHSLTFKLARKNRKDTRRAELCLSYSTTKPPRLQKTLEASALETKVFPTRTISSTGSYLTL